MSWLEDHMWKQWAKADRDPEWMKGRFGTIFYGLMAAIFFLIVVGALVSRVVNGPPAKPNASVNSTASTNSTGAF